MPGSFKIADFDPEVREILKSTFEEAATEIEAIAPKAPNVIDYEEIEEKLLAYIKANNGVIRPKRAAKELGVPPAIIKETLYRLARKGKISLSKTSQEAQPA
jgi:hypothetical protein